MDSRDVITKDVTIGSLKEGMKKQDVEKVVPLIAGAAVGGAIGTGLYYGTGRHRATRAHYRKLRGEGKNRLDAWLRSRVKRPLKMGRKEALKSTAKKGKWSLQGYKGV